MRDINSAADEIISRRLRANRSGSHGVSGEPTNEGVWLKRMQHKANRIPIMAECAITTPLETLNPKIIFIPKEIF